MDADEFEGIAREQKDRLHSYAVWMLRNLHEAQDVTQEALLRLWSRRRTIPAVAARSWLTRTVHNLCVDRRRRRSVRREADVAELSDRIEDRSPGPDRDAGARQTRRAILRAMEGLSERDRGVLIMREAQGMAYEEIAEALGVPLGTLKAVLHRARERLRRALVGAGVEP